MSVPEEHDDDLRRRAEALLRDTAHASRAGMDLQRLVHELEVHQIELELQNEELRRTQEELQRARDRYFELYDLAPVGYMSLDPQGRIVETNLTATSMLGVPRKRLVGSPLPRYIRARDGERFHLHLQEVFADAEERSLELELRRSDGPPLPVLLTSRAVDEAGRRVCRSVFVDLSEKHRLQTDLDEREAELRESTARFRRLAETIDDVFYIADVRTGALVYVSPAYETVVGCAAPAPGDGEGWLACVHAEDRDRVTAARDKLAAGVRMDLAYRIQRPDGEVRILRDRAFPTGDAHQVAGIVRDITEERRMQDGLQQARQMEAIGTLTSGIAHDFNNLLMGIAGGIDIALEQLDPGHEARPAVARARQAAMRGTDLVRRLLDFTRTRAKAPERVELDAVVTETRHLLGPLLGEHIDVILELGAPGLFLHADAAELEQVLVNLAVNARDAMPQGGTLRIRTCEAGPAPGAAEPRPQVVLTVSDTGTGMDEDTRARVFEPFFTTKAPGKGTGLGLSSVYAVVQRLGGTIEIDSAPGVGTTFTLAFPVVEAEARPARPWTQAARGAGTVLLVEDDELVKTTVSFYLESLGYDVVSVSHPSDTLAAIERHGGAVDLAVTDVMMPGKLGHELAAELHERWPDLPIVYMSAQPREALLRERQLPPDAILLQKPFDEHRLGHALARALKHAPPTAVPSPLDTTSTTRRVLVVDDDPSTLELLGELLRLKGHEVTSATNVEQALDDAHSFRPDVILSDLSLGGTKTGLDLARVIKSDDALRHTHLVALTGFSSPEHRRQALDAGFDTFATKPLELGQLERLLDTET